MGQKFEQMFPVLLLSKDKLFLGSLDRAVKRFEDSGINFNFLTQYEDGKILSHALQNQLNHFGYDDAKKIAFFIFCLSYKKLADQATKGLLYLANHNHAATLSINSLDLRHLFSPLFFIENRPVNHGLIAYL